MRIGGRPDGSHPSCLTVLGYTCWYGVGDKCMTLDAYCGTWCPIHTNYMCGGKVSAEGSRNNVRLAYTNEYGNVETVPLNRCEYRCKIYCNLCADWRQVWTTNGAPQHIYLTGDYCWGSEQPPDS
jgi:hypothetical protein